MSTEKPPSLRDTIQSKIAELIDDFRNAEISPEQFNAVYARYQKQLELASRVVKEDVEGHSVDEGTFKLEDIRMGKASGIAIYHHQNQHFIATFGNYNLSIDTVAPILRDCGTRLADDVYVDSAVVRLDTNRWIVYVTEDYTTAIVIYDKEPSAHRVRGLERIMRDFEHANRSLLQTRPVDSNKLAQPFLSVVKLAKG